MRLAFYMAQSDVSVRPSIINKCMQKYANCLLTNFQVFVLHYDLLSAVEMHYKIA